MSTLPCITTWEGHRGCYVVGEHTVACRDVRVVKGRLVPCDGCLPQPAAHGVMCESCWRRYEDAIDVAVDLTTHLRSVERGPRADGPRTRSAPGPRSLMPPSWQEADRVWAALHELAFRCDPLEFLEVGRGDTTADWFGAYASIDDVADRVGLAVDIAMTGSVSNATVAWRAVGFYRAVERALGRFPLSQKPMRLPLIACPAARGGCGMVTLERRPPDGYLDVLAYRCINPLCGKVWDLAVIEAEAAALVAA